MEKNKSLKLRREVGGVHGDELTGREQFFDVDDKSWKNVFFNSTTNGLEPNYIYNSVLRGYTENKLFVYGDKLTQEGRI